MQGHLAEMIARHAQPGRIDWIGLRPERRGAMEEAAGARLEAAGLAGDHGRAGPRALTLIQSEHLAAIAACLGQAAPVPPALLRRNLVVAGINLAGLRGRALRLGGDGAVIEITGPCAPCSRMEEALGHGGYSAMRGHGGWCARVLAPGALARGDGVIPL